MSIISRLGKVFSRFNRTHQKNVQEVKNVARERLYWVMEDARRANQSSAKQLQLQPVQKKSFSQQDPKLQLESFIASFGKGAPSIEIGLKLTQLTKQTKRQIYQPRNINIKNIVRRNTIYKPKDITQPNVASPPPLPPVCSLEVTKLVKKREDPLEPTPHISITPPQPPDNTNININNNINNSLNIKDNNNNNNNNINNNTTTTTTIINNDNNNNKNEYNEKNNETNNNNNNNNNINNNNSNNNNNNNNNAVPQEEKAKNTSVDYNSKYNIDSQFYRIEYAIEEESPIPPWISTELDEDDLVDSKRLSNLNHYKKSASTVNRKEKVQISLGMIRGVGPRVLERLEENGVTDIHQLCALSDHELHLLKKFIPKIIIVRSRAEEILRSKDKEN